MPKETELLDPAVGARVRFRLSGDYPVWPPAILFRIYLTAPLCDVNAFAPREYAAAASTHAPPRPPMRLPATPATGGGLPEPSIRGYASNSPQATALQVIAGRGGGSGMTGLAPRADGSAAASASPSRALPPPSQQRALRVEQPPPGGKLESLPSASPLETRLGSRSGVSGGANSELVVGSSASFLSPPSARARVGRGGGDNTSDGALRRGGQAAALLGIRVGKTVFGARLGDNADDSSGTGSRGHATAAAATGSTRLPHLPQLTPKRPAVSGARSPLAGNGAAVVASGGAGSVSLVLFSTAPELLELSSLPALSAHAGGAVAGAAQAGRAPLSKTTGRVMGSATASLQATLGALPPAATTVGRAAAAAAWAGGGRASAGGSVASRVILQSSDDCVPDGWYQRDSLTLNDWRPVSLAQVEAADGVDPALRLRRSIAMAYRPPRSSGPTLVQARLATKRRRRKWLATLYERGKAATAEPTPAGVARGAGARRAGGDTAAADVGGAAAGGALGLLVAGVSAEGTGEPMSLHAVGLLLEAALVAGAAAAAEEAEAAKAGEGADSPPGEGQRVLLARSSLPLLPPASPLGNSPRGAAVPAASWGGTPGGPSSPLSPSPGIAAAVHGPPSPSLMAALVVGAAPVAAPPHAVSSSASALSLALTSAPAVGAGGDWGSQDAADDSAAPDARVQRAYDVAANSAVAFLRRAAAAQRAALEKDLEPVATIVPLPQGQQPAGGSGGATGSDPFDAYAASWRALGTSLRPVPTVAAAARRR